MRRRWEASPGRDISKPDQRLVPLLPSKRTRRLSGSRSGLGRRYGTAVCLPCAVSFSLVIRNGNRQQEGNINQGQTTVPAFRQQNATGPCKPRSISSILRALTSRRRGGATLLGMGAIQHIGLSGFLG